MLLETQEVVLSRQKASRKWLEIWSDNFIECPENQPKNKVERALMVLILTPKTSDYLAEYDPQALKQAQKALTGNSWEDYNESKRI